MFENLRVNLTFKSFAHNSIQKKNLTKYLNRVPQINACRVTTFAICTYKWKFFHDCLCKEKDIWSEVPLLVLFAYDFGFVDLTTTLNQGLVKKFSTSNSNFRSANSWCHKLMCFVWVVCLHPFLGFHMRRCSAVF